VLVHRQQVIFMGLTFISTKLFMISQAPPTPQWPRSGWSIGSAGPWGRKGHTNPGDGPQAHRAMGRRECQTACRGRTVLRRRNQVPGLIFMTA
jgi:hypothetical protein